MSNLAGILKENRYFLSLLHRHSNGVLDISDAANILNLDRESTSKLMSALVNNGWAKRIKRNIYLLIPLQATRPDDWKADSWLIADYIYRPMYIAGWTAIEHWGLTEQIFLSVCVFSQSNFRKSNQSYDEIRFVIKKTTPQLFFGLSTVWKENQKIKVSDPTKTIIDILAEPSWGGDFTHTYQTVINYIESEFFDEEKLISYLNLFKNSSPAKRLGFIMSKKFPEKKEFIKEIHSLINTGFIRLDPSLPSKGFYNSTWNIQVNRGIND